MHPRTVVRVAAACLALAACDSSTGSTPLEDVYVLQSLEGRPLPATLDSASASSGPTTYTVRRLLGGSVEILGADSVRYTRSEVLVTYFTTGDSAFSGTCFSMPVPYRIQGDRMVLIVEPALWGGTGRLRLDSLQIGDETLVQNTRNAAGTPVRLQYAAAGQPAGCAPNLP